MDPLNSSPLTRAGDRYPFRYNAFVRLWTLHPRYLDTKGLLALWREGLLAQSVILEQTAGYRNHPQLTRFKANSSSVYE
jgi:hypothetical protein